MKTASGLWTIALCGVAVVYPGTLTLAQLVPDTTLGAEGSIVNDGTMNGLPAQLIEGGASRGANLFHSFGEFNVGDLQQVYFANPDGIANILTRVTGSNASNILGTLGVNGSANLFLLNPNGIIFGPNAQLDVRGSFVASTAKSFLFADGSEFSATNPDGPPLLTVNVPLGLQYGTNRPQGDISNAGDLAVGAGQSLTLFGNTVTSTGGLSASGGTVQLLGNRVGLLEKATVDVSSPTGGGTVLIGGDYQGKGTVPNALRTFVGEEVAIHADGLTDGDGGRVIVWADEVAGFYGTISARGGSNSGDGGFVEVSGKQELIFRGEVDASAINGTMGTLLLDPTDITIVNGDGGADDDQLRPNAGQIFSWQGSPRSFTISERTLEDGRLANVNVLLQAEQNIFIDDLDDNELRFANGPGGDVGTITFDARNGSFLMRDTNDGIVAPFRNLTITAGNNITAGTISVINAFDSDVNSGTLRLDAGGNISVVSLMTQTSFESTANAGDIIVDAGGTFTAVSVEAFTSGDVPSGNAGAINITAGGDIEIQAVTAFNGGLDGNGGNIFIQSNGGSIQLVNNGVIGPSFGRTLSLEPGISATARQDVNPSGLGGPIVLRAAQDIDLDSGVFTTGRGIELTSFNGDINAQILQSNGNSTGRNINLTANRGDVRFSTIDTGNGNLNVTGSGDVRFSNINTGDGNLTVTGRTIEQTGSTINVRGNASFTSTRPNTGNVEVNNNNATRLGSSTIGGNLTLTSGGVVSRFPGQFVQVAGTATINGVIDPRFRNPGNIIPILIDPNTGDVEINRVGLVTLPTRTVAGNLTVTSFARSPAQFTGIYDGDAIVLDGSNNFAGTLRLNTASSDIGSISATPGIRQTGSQSVTGTATFIAGTGDIILNNPNNQFNDLSFVGGNVSIVNSQGTNLVAGSRTNFVLEADNLNLISGSAITQDAALQVRGNASFLTNQANAGEVSFANTDDILLDNSAIGGDLTLRSRGSISQLPGSVLQMAGDNIVLDAPGRIDLTNGGNTIPTLRLPNGDVVITQVGSVNLPAQTVTGNLTVNSKANGIRFLGAFSDPAITLDNPDNSVRGTVSLNTALPPSVPIAGTPEITQTGSISVGKTATFNAISGNITLTDPANQFQNLAVNGSNVSVRTNSPTTLHPSTVTNALNLTSVGEINQNGGLQGSAAFQFTNLLPDSPINLRDRRNQVSGAVGFTTTGTGNVELFNNRDTQLTTSTIGGNFTANTNGSLSQINPVRVAGEAILDTRTQDLDLNLANDFNTVTLRNTRNATLRDINDINFNTSRVTGNLAIASGGTLSVNENQTLSTRATISGQSTDINIFAESVRLLSRSRLVTTSSGQARTGNIAINTQRLLIQNNSPDSTRTTGIDTDTSPGSSSDGGNITIHASESVELFGNRPGAFIADPSDPVSIARAGAISVGITAASRGEGRGGNIDISTGRLVIRDGAGITSSSLSIADNAGDGGEVRVKATDVEFRGLAGLATATVGAGNAGSVFVEAARITLDDGAAITADSVVGASGNAGNIGITTSQLNLNNHSLIGATTGGTGLGGNISLNASQGVEVNHQSRIASQSTGQGNAGNLSITTERLNVFNQSQIAVSSIGTGNAGTLAINANNIRLTNQGKLNATIFSGQGGNIDLQVADSIILRDNSEITAEAFGRASGGNMTLNVGGFILAVLQENSDIVASAVEGEGGSISATATGVFGFRQFNGERTPESDFTATSTLGVDGAVEVNAESSVNVPELPQISSPPRVQSTCNTAGTRTEQQIENNFNNFIVTGRGGKAPGPEEISGNAVWEDLRPPTLNGEQDGNSGAIELENSGSERLVEAQGWVVGANGNIILTAEPPNVTLASSPTQETCSYPRR